VIVGATLGAIGLACGAYLMLFGEGVLVLLGALYIFVCIVSLGIGWSARD